MHDSITNAEMLYINECILLEREREVRGTCFSWPEVGKGRMVAESTSPVGRGTAGLLLMKGMPPLLSGTNGTVTGELAAAAAAGAGDGPDKAAW